MTIVALLYYLELAADRLLSHFPFPSRYDGVLERVTFARRGRLLPSAAGTAANELVACCGGDGHVEANLKIPSLPDGNTAPDGVVLGAIPPAPSRPSGTGQQTAILAGARSWSVAAEFRVLLVTRHFNCFPRAERKTPMNLELSRRRAT